MSEASEMMRVGEESWTERERVVGALEEAAKEVEAVLARAWQAESPAELRGRLGALCARLCGAVSGSEAPSEEEEERRGVLGGEAWYEEEKEGEWVRYVHKDEHESVEEVKECLRGELRQLDTVLQYYEEDNEEARREVYARHAHLLAYVCVVADAADELHELVERVRGREHGREQAQHLLNSRSGETHQPLVYVAAMLQSASVLTYMLSNEEVCLAPQLASYTVNAYALMPVPFECIGCRALAAVQGHSHHLLMCEHLNDKAAWMDALGLQSLVHTFAEMSKKVGTEYSERGEQCCAQHACEADDAVDVDDLLRGGGGGDEEERFVPASRERKRARGKETEAPPHANKRQRSPARGPEHECALE